jgi:hypothetical protein
MKNITMHQMKAMTIQVPSTRSSGCFHQTRSVGEWIAVMVVSGLAYFATGMPTISITPHTM